MVCNALKIHCWSLDKISIKCSYVLDYIAALRSMLRIRTERRAADRAHGLRTPATEKYIKQGQLPSHVADGSGIFTSSSNIDLVVYTFSYALASATVITREELGRTQFCGAVLINSNSTSALHSLHNCEWCVSMLTSCLFVMESGELRDNILQEGAAPSATPAPRPST